MDYTPPWRRYKNEIETVNISRGVTNISDGVFEDCDNLTNISIPDSVIKIEVDAFSGCHHLTNIEIPNSVTIIGEGAFEACSSITDLTIPNSVTSIGNSAFEYCSSITDLTIPSSVTVIGYEAFSYCSGLKSIKVDENNKKYDSRDNCNAIVSTEENELLQGCTNTIIPNNIECIGYGAFEGSDINKIIIPDSVVQIKGAAFNGCSELKELTLPCSVKIDDYGRDNYYYRTTGSTFRGVSQLEKVTFTKGTGKMSPYTDEEDDYSCMYYTHTPWFSSTHRYYDEYNDGAHAIPLPSTLSEIVLEEGIESIGDFVFCDCRIKNIVLPNSVNSLGNGSFKDCSDLENITIPNNVTNIGESAFSGCSSFKKITIPNKVTNIGASAFSGCSGLTNITIPDSVTSIGESAFSGCSSLKSIILPNNSNVTIGKNIFEGCNNLIDLYVANDKLSLMNIEIPNKVTIHCNYDSAAYWYAKQNGNKIVLISDETTKPIITEEETTTKQESTTVPPEKVTTPAKVKFSVRAGKKKASLKWEKVTAVKGYTVYYKTSKKGTWKKLKTVSNKKTSYTKKKLKSGKTYYFTVKAYKKVNGKKVYGKFTIKKVKVK